MFSIKSEGIEVTERMRAAGCWPLWDFNVGEWKTDPIVVEAIYRAMEKARRNAQIGIVWGEPPIEQPKG